ncbi:hypothetical protein Tco_0014705 [Tanacetum coccineum]
MVDISFGKTLKAKLLFCSPSLEFFVDESSTEMGTGAKDAIKALTSKLQSMSIRAFMRKQAKAHVDTPTCARQLMYSSTHGTCDIEARDINNSCNATLVPVLHTSHGVNTSPFDDTGDKNCRISGSSSLLQSMSPRAFMQKQANAHVDTPTCARQLMYSSTHGTCDIEAMDINNSWLEVLLMNRVPRWGQVSAPASFRKHGKEESSSNNPSKQKACQQSVEPTVKRKGAKDAIKALTSKFELNNTYKLQSMSPRAFMRKQAKAHVNTPTCAKQLMYSSTHGTCEIDGHKKFFREREAERWWEDNQQEVYKYYNVDGYINSV